jgi:predicted transcriptional regulator
MRVDQCQRYYTPVGPKSTETTPIVPLTGHVPAEVLIFYPYAKFTAPFPGPLRLRVMVGSNSMNSQPHNDLSRRERQIIDILYSQGRATAAEVQAVLPEPPSYSAVRAMLRILEEKGHVRHEQDGPRYVYLPTVGRDNAKKSAMRHMLQTFFDGSAEQAISSLLGDPAARLSDAELDRLATLIDRARKAGV